MGTPISIHFLLCPGFADLELASALWPLRTCNRLTGEPCFVWQCWSMADSPLLSDAGLPLAVSPWPGLDKIRYDWLFVLGNPKDLISATIRWDHLPRYATMAGAIGPAAGYMARYGWFDGYQVVLHEADGSYPKVHLRQDLFVIDRQRASCRSGTAALDMMSMLVGRELGMDLARSLSQCLIDERLGSRTRHIRKRLLTRQKMTQPKLAEAVALMEANIEEPLSSQEIAAHVVLSKRQMERLFNEYLEVPPSRYYLLLRIEHAHHLLQNSPQAIAQIALACGFSSSAHFTTAYRSVYGKTPSEVRGR